MRAWNVIQIVLVINNPVEDGSYLAESRDQHDARDECDACSERGKKRENHQRIANVIIPDIDEFVRDDVVAVVGGPWCSHGVAVQIEDSSYDCEQRDELKLQNSLINDSLSTRAQQLILTMPTMDMMIAPFWMLIYWLFFTSGLWYQGMWIDLVDLDSWDLQRKF